MWERLFLGSSTKRMERAFAAQFTPDGDGYLFRRGGCGSAVRVSAAERDSFVADFMRGWRRRYWGIFGGMFAVAIIVMGLSLAFDIDPGSRLFALITYGLIIALAAGFVGLQMRAYSEPARMLDHRMPVSAPLTRTESRRHLLARMDWRQIAFSVVLGVGLLASNWPATGNYTIWSLIPFGFGVIMLALGLWAAVCKWQLRNNA